MSRFVLPLSSLVLLSACLPTGDEGPGAPLDTADADTDTDADTDADTDSDTDTDCEAPAHTRETPTDAMLAAAEGNNRLAVGLLRERPDENPFLSPLSVSTALGMTLAGAEGETAAELREVLGGTGDDAALHEGLAGLAATLQAGAASNTTDCQSWVFASGNAAFLDARLGILEPYVATLTDVYGSPPQNVDFLNDEQGAADTINAWASDRTNGAIDDIADPAAYDYHTLLVLANAVAFGGSWETPFPGDATATRDFHLADGSTRPVTMMSGLASRAWAELDGAYAVELAYRGDDLDMVIVVPWAYDGLDAVLAGLDPADLSHAAMLLNPVGEILVAMPKWEVRSDASLKPSLEALGVVHAFDQFTADLSSIAPPPPEFENLFVGDVVHAAWVRVDEAGTEASAATTVEIEGSDSAAPYPEYISADRPFAYFIRDRVTGVILFAGRMDAPAEATENP